MTLLALSLWVWVGGAVFAVLILLMIVGVLVGAQSAPAPAVKKPGEPWPLWARPDGQEVFTSEALLAGRTYRLTVTGTYSYRSWGVWSNADAFHLTEENLNFTKPYDGLYLDGKSLKRWLHFVRAADRQHHRYVFDVDGAGQPLSVALRAPRHGAMGGALTVTFELLPQGAASPAGEEQRRERKARAQERLAKLQRERGERIGIHQAAQAAAQAQAEAKREKAREERRARLEARKRVADADKAKADAQRAIAEREIAVLAEKSAREQKALAAAAAQAAARKELEKRIRPWRSRADELWAATESRRNWESETFRRNYAHRNRAKVLTDKERVLEEHRTLYEREGPAFMDYLARTGRQSSLPFHIPVDGVVDSTELRSQDLKLFYRLTGEFEAMLEAERLEVAAPQPPPPLPPRRKPSVEEYRQRAVQRLRVQIGDHEAIMDTIMKEKARLHEKAAAAGASEEQIESNLALLDAQMAPHLENLVDRGGHTNAVAKRSKLLN